MINKLILHIISLLNKVILKNKNKIIFFSSPDLSDNSFAFFKYLIENYPHKYTLIWLIDNKNHVKQYHNMIKNNIILTNEIFLKIKFIQRNSLLGFYHYINSKYIFFTHGFYTGMSSPKKQIRINLWHGMPLKALGNLLKNKIATPNFSYTIATSELYQEIMAKVFNIPTDNVLLLGQPRYDLLSIKNDTLIHFGIQKEHYTSIIFWAPTFRRAIDKDMKDGEFTDGLPVITINMLIDLNDYLHKLNSYLLIKLHPMDVLNHHPLKKMSHIKVIQNNFLLNNNLQLYAILNQIDILITDFSSIYIDFLLLNKPIIFMTDDFDSYQNTRGFVFENPQEYMPGDFVTSYSQLKIAINRLLLDKKDIYASKRLKIKKLFHKYDSDFSHRLYRLLKM